MPSSVDYPPILTWEDADPHSDGERWWLAYAHDEGEAGVRDFFVAEDDISGYLVGIVRLRANGLYRVVAAALLSDAVHRADAVVTIKDQIAGWLVSPRETTTLGFVRRWRRRRFWVIVRANVPLAIGAGLVGGVLGVIVALFALSSGLVGWPMLVAGLLIGAGAGTVLKFIADRKPAPGASAVLAGSWARFAVVTIAAVAGAGLAAGSVLTLFTT